MTMSTKADPESTQKEMCTVSILHKCRHQVKSKRKWQCYVRENKVKAKTKPIYYVLKPTICPVKLLNDEQSVNEYKQNKTNCIAYCVLSFPAVDSIKEKK